MASDFRHSNACFGISEADGVCHSFDDVFFHLAIRTSVSNDGSGDHGNGGHWHRKVELWSILTVRMDWLLANCCLLGWWSEILPSNNNFPSKVSLGFTCDSHFSQRTGKSQSTRHWVQHKPQLAHVWTQSTTVKHPYFEVQAVCLQGCRSKLPVNHISPDTGHTPSNGLQGGYRLQRFHWYHPAPIIVCKWATGKMQYNKTRFIQGRYRFWEFAVSVYMVWCASSDFCLLVWV